MLKSSDKKIKKCFIWLCAAVLMCALPVFAIMYSDLSEDNWFMFVHGKYILANGLYPEYEPFTVHEGLHFTFQKWLSCIMYWLIYKNLGAVGLKAFHAVIICAFFMAIFCLLNYISPCRRKIYNAVIVSFVGLFFLSYIETRPQLFTYLFLALELLCLEKFVRENNRKALLFIPLISLVEMQIHSTIWPIILIFMLPYMFDISNMKFMRKFAFIPKRDYNRGLIWIAFIASIAAGFINPYGAESIVYLFKSLTISELQTVGEVQAPELISTNTFAMVGFTIWLLVLIFRNKKIEMRYVFCFAEHC